MLNTVADEQMPAPAHLPVSLHGIVPLVLPDDVAAVQLPHQRRIPHHHEARSTDVGEQMGQPPVVLGSEPGRVVVLSQVRRIKEEERVLSIVLEHGILEGLQEDFGSAKEPDILRVQEPVA